MKRKIAFYRHALSMKPQVKYDPKVNILRIRFSRKRSVDSEVKNNIVIDYDEKGNIVNLEIMEVNLQEFSKIKSLKKLIPISIGY